MNRLAEALKNTPFLVLDGALATELERAGMDLADPLWSASALMEAPEAILRVHRSYLEAGADIITSAGYQATIPGFMAKGCSRKEAERLLRLAVRLVKRARDEYEAETGRRALAAASAGPYGAYLADGSEYSGHYDLSRRELADFHRERALILADEAPDLLAFETVPSLAEAEAIADAVSALPAGSAWFSFSCRDGETACAGDRAEDCAAFLAGIQQIAAIGANCTAPAHIAALIGRFRAAGKPVIVYPNSGETWNKESGAWEGAPSDFGALAPEWNRAGARIIGGCCRTSPETVLALVRARKTMKP